MLSDFQNIEEIEIKYQNESSSEISNPEEAISEAKKLIHKKVDIAWDVRISFDPNYYDCFSF